MGAGWTMAADGIPATGGGAMNDPAGGADGTCVPATPGVGGKLGAVGERGGSIRSMAGWPSNEDGGCPDGTEGRAEWSDGTEGRIVSEGADGA